ncbi:putative secreted protein (Por secretion system target) [Flavobacterium sp. 270]|uniref:T9SS type A sorting domain-containing protein n=1 Tax=Flavobacterium sp. 270 TaxID=2512114 RepID=UPI001065FA51|nr:T9SS type A sorting domain-containing protein [Flavobacterium sp. 270]TDW52758.1 putative secreted protein (Por secretion system target) [Flavobacterium sp. 270]
MEHSRTYTIGNVKVGFNYSGTTGLGGCWGINWTEKDNGYFTFTFDVPVAGVRIYGVDWDRSSSITQNIAVSVNDNPYNLQASNLSSYSYGNSCNQGSRTAQGSISGGNFINGSGTLTITQPRITTLKIQNSGNGNWGFAVEILPLFVTANTPCTGSALNLTSDFAGLTSGASYNWTGPNGFTSSLKNPSIGNATEVNSGVYTVTASNGSVTASQTKNVYVNPIPSVNVINNQILCNGSSVNAVNFSSPVNKGIMCGNVNEGDILNLTAPPGSIFNDILFASYGNPVGSCGNFVLGTCNSPNSTTVVSNAALGKNSFNLAATNNNFGDPCNGMAKSLKIQLGYDIPVTYSWTNNNTLIGLAASGTGNILSFIATNTTNTPITATITVTPKYTNGGSSCQGTSKTFTITVNPTPKITTQPISKSICSGESATFTAVANNASTYQWQVNTGSGFIDISDAAQYSGATTNTLTIKVSTLLNDYKYRLLASGSCGPAAISNTATITVPTISGTVIVNNVSCNGESDGSINLTPSGGTSPYTFNWNGAANTEDRTNLPQGTYNVTITDSKGCIGTVSATITEPNIVDSPTGDAIQSFNAGNDLNALLVTGQNVKWYATAVNASNHVNELPLSTIIINDTTYYATQTSGSCESPTSLAVKAYNPLLSLNDTIKPDLALRLYPNPAKDMLYLNSEIEIDKIVIFDINGRILLEKTLNGDHKINIQALAKNVYFIKIFTQNKGEEKTIKFIKD